jgi:hypothetical protein
MIKASCRSATRECASTCRRILRADRGIVVMNLLNQNGCDSVHTITTALLLSDSTFENLASCNPADTGIVVMNLLNQNGCDSVHTITTALLLSDSTFEILSS